MRLPFRGRAQQRLAFAAARRGQRGRGEWQGAVGAGHLPERQVPVAAQGRERPGGGERLEIAAIERGARGEILDAGEGALPRAATRRCAPACDSDFTMRSPSRSAGAPSARRSSVQSQPLAHTSTGAHLDAVRARIAHQLRRRVEAHRLAVEQRAGEGRRLVALEPGGVVHQQREAQRVALGEAVFAEAQDLLVDALRELLAGSRARACRRSSRSLERLEAAASLPGGHRAAQRVRLARREAGGDDRDLHHLLLEDRHAERALQHRASPPRSG